MKIENNNTVNQQHVNLKNKIGYIVMLTLMVIVSSCSVKKYIPDDEFLLRNYNLEVTPDSAVIIKDLSLLKAELELALSPQPNKSVLGMRPGLHYWYRVNVDSAGFISKFLNKRIGEVPVYLSDVSEEKTRDLFRNRLENRGFFYSSVSTMTVRDSISKNATVRYTIKVPKPYTMETFQVEKDSTAFNMVLQEQLQNAPLEKGMRFNLAAMTQERARIHSDLKEKGYYNFNSSFLIFQADTNQYKNRRFDLFLKLKKDVPAKAVVPYRLRNVAVYPNNTIPLDTVRIDSTRFNNRSYLQEDIFFRPDRLDPFITLKENALYSPTASKTTSRRLGTIGAYKFVNIEYTEIDSIATDSIRYLDANIYLSPLNKRALRAELQAVTKSNDFAGPSLGLTFTNRNLFKGGEILNINARAAYEIQIAAADQAGLTSLQFGLGADLIFPRVLFPVKISDNYFKYSIPKTKTGLEVDLLNRSELYGLLTFKGTFGYIWQASKFVTHEINPISLNYVNLTNTSTEFEAILARNAFLENSFEQQFISGLTYSFTYNGMLDTSARSLFYINSTVDVAGNSISLLDSTGDSGRNEFLGQEYAQYAKVDVDFRYHYRFSEESRIATRLFAGYGLPYGNSDVMPFSKQYFAGGAYSVRAFRTRSLGPGTYTVPVGDDRSFFDQSGNVRLEANVEYRFPIFGYVKGAVFADAGNVWSTSDETLPGGRLSSNFYNELGIGSGIGLRVDVQGFVIRFDLAAPLHDPSLEENERWNFDVANPVFNFAIGYPF